MIKQVEELLKKNNVHLHKNQGITVVNVKDLFSGIDLAAKILYQVIDRRTVFYLSGGTTPKLLYKKIAHEELLLPGAVGQVDERFGASLHENSNQLMIRDSGLLRYLEIRDIPFYPMLQNHERIKTADDYDQKVRDLNAVYSKNVAILGIGDDGHTAGIPADNNTNFKSNDSNYYKENHKLVIEYDDMDGKYGERVTTTFLGLSMYDLYIILVFGSGKKHALDQMFEDGSESEIPSRFYKREYIANKTLLITDQTV